MSKRSRDDSNNSDTSGNSSDCVIMQPTKKKCKLVTGGVNHHRLCGLKGARM